MHDVYFNRTVLALISKSEQGVFDNTILHTLGRMTTSCSMARIGSRVRDASLGPGLKIDLTSIRKIVNLRIHSQRGIEHHRRCVI